MNKLRDVMKNNDENPNNQNKDIPLKYRTCNAKKLSKNS